MIRQDSVSRPDMDPDGRYLFSGVAVCSPLYELEEVYKRRARALRAVEDAERARRLERAYAMARQQLERALTRSDIRAGEDR